jgi:hypothetical protein
MSGEQPPGSGTAAPAPSRPRLDRTTGVAAAVWLASRAGVFLAATYATWVFAGSSTEFIGTPIPDAGPIATWNRWDVAWYASIARDGYGAAGFENSYAFMPGFPSLLWAFGKLNVHPTLAGLVISLVAGLVAAVALAALTTRVGGRGELAVLAWVLAPSAVYLAAPYAEALFCALAFWCWHLARGGRWLTAAVLCSGACLVRVNGLFLACALAVLFATTRPRPWRSAGWLALPFATCLTIVAWFHAQTGSWSTWLDAQASGWNRSFTNPWETLNATVDFAFRIGISATYGIQYRLELAAMAVVVALAVVMLVQRWWGEAAYVLLTAASLATSTVYYSVPRATLVLFPIWMLLGCWMTGRRWLQVAYVTIAAPLMIVGVAAFVTGRWVG